MKIVYMMVGLPGSGKSTYIKNHMFLGDAWISRDQIRFSLLKEGEDYFAHEKEVFRIWLKKINSAIDDIGIDTIWIDATHLNESSRAKTLRRLHLDKVDKVIAIYFNLPIDECKRRNAQRIGRELVSEAVIENMALLLTDPRKDHEHKFDRVVEINE